MPTFLDYLRPAPRQIGLLNAHMPWASSEVLTEKECSDEELFLVLAG